MGEKIAKLGIKRDNDLMYYIKNGDVWATPRKKPGQPKGKASKVASAANNKEMLERVLEAEHKAIEGYTKRAEQAAKFGDKGLQVQLEDMIRDESGHYEETERMLREWPI